MSRAAVTPAGREPAGGAGQDHDRTRSPWDGAWWVCRFGIVPGGHTRKGTGGNVLRCGTGGQVPRCGIGGHTTDAAPEP
ncbi:hypothetical protein Ate01nite_60760 [Actinoplanes teichomyceticus]|nr:hypothetical protein Ate01nite_60760 [Actinoplanes teichomyceticus]